MKFSSYNDLISCWKDLGIEKGDHLVCHSFLHSVGKVEGGMGVFIDSIIDVLGERGAFYVPSFTYSFMNNEIFDVELSKSKVGKLSDILMDKYQAIRSLDPNFSWVGLDNSSQDLLRIDTKESFGKNSFFDKLRSVR